MTSTETRTVQERLRATVVAWQSPTCIAATDDLRQAADRIDALEKALKTARDQVIAFMLDSHTPEQALKNVKYIDDLLARAALHPSDNEVK